ncbi:hypothetical protein Bhyg_16251 [Pseudolycoriella hygida]|uniref:Uncharacterized protein n=1 Tax=Pseudolycoriella hygida TaxID=35572 RepID=A0A9Q0MQJ6_9DIPT|nr:hypothetical protein Bhyg_16251 [Pseudolycoriella hygida]
MNEEGRRIRVIQVAGRLFNEVAYKPIDKLTHVSTITERGGISVINVDSRLVEKVI